MMKHTFLNQYCDTVNLFKRLRPICRQYNAPKSRHCMLQVEAKLNQKVSICLILLYFPFFPYDVSFVIAIKIGVHEPKIDWNWMNVCNFSGPSALRGQWITRKSDFLSQQWKWILCVGFILIHTISPHTFSYILQYPCRPNSRK